MSPFRPDDYSHVALEFAKALANRDYAPAYAMTSHEYRLGTTLERMRDAFEAIVPTDWGPIGAVDIGHTMEDWPDKQPSDLGWAYVSIGGDVYSEAVTIVVTREDGTMKVRTVEFGRP
jgi:hypothetical protein